MLELKNIRKAYVTAGFTQVALDDVSVAFRDNEFVAVLGASGSGKTTMLNILGGLDHADSGDIVINGISTKDYTDKDWDTYRNHRIGFIFQSYNLIPHQSVVSNVELALTLAGLSGGVRRERALAALERVGLAEHANKRPNQLSGGQMQRVAIARALVNDPDIVLADEPTGALDTETGIQVMNLLAEIAQDRLVVMVTHNPELAEEYATRIIRLTDGRIVDDTDPYEVGQPVRARTSGAKHLPAGTGVSDATRHASMSLLTALSLSFNNLMTKKGRTFMTAFAGSIGIIGIAAILALSNGVNDYIAKTEEEALSSYPLTITKSSFDLTGLMVARMASEDADAAEEKPGAEQLIQQNSIMSDMFAQVKNNDLKSFRAFLESGNSGMEPYVNSIQYSYGLNPLIYKADTSESVVRLNPSRMGSTLTNGLAGSAFLGGSSMSSFTELLDDERLVDQSLDLVEGRWPEAYDECVFVLGRNGGITDYTLYSLGVYDIKVMDDMLTKALAGEEVTVPTTHKDFSRADAMNMHFSVVAPPLLYRKNDEQGTWTDMTGDKSYMRTMLAEEAIDLHVVGIVQQSDDASSSGVPEGIAYTSALTRHLMEVSQQSTIVKEQQANTEVDVFTGKTFEELADEEGRDFNMEDAFSVDEEALKNAFSFDTSALDGFGEGMDLSGLDLGSSVDPSSFDLSGMQLDTSALSSVFSEDTMKQVMAGAPQFNLENFDLSTEGVELSEEQQKQLNEAAQELQASFMAWMAMPENAEAVGKAMTADPPDYASLIQAYLETEEAQEIIAPVSEMLQQEFGPIIEQRINDAMSYYMTEQFAPYISQAMGQLMQQAAQAFGTQMAEQLGTQIGAQIALMTGEIGNQLGSALAGAMEGQMAELSSALEGGFSVDTDAFANAIQFNMTQDDLTSLLTNYMNADELTYEGNLAKLGFAEVENPESISIYPIDFEAKERVLEIVDGYNDKMEEEGRDEETIQYSDIAGVLMSSVTDIVNTISLVLIAFVSISLVVSSIMISIITYISVLERKKEIGILRAMGASKLNVANIFNAETVIEGFFAGVLAMVVVFAASVPVNEIVYRLKDVPNIMQLSPTNAISLVAVSVFLTLIAGLIPSSAAARRDPVEALRSE